MTIARFDGARRKANRCAHVSARSVPAARSRYRKNQRSRYRGVGGPRAPLASARDPERAVVFIASPRRRWLLLLLLGDRSLGRLKSDLAVRAIAERLRHRGAAPAEGNSRPPCRVDLVASWDVQIHLTFHDIRPIRAGGDLHGLVRFSLTWSTDPLDIKTPGPLNR